MEKKVGELTNKVDDVIGKVGVYTISHLICEIEVNAKNSERVPFDRQIHEV